MEIKTLVTWDTEFSADSVEWCPIAPYQHTFVCGTYQLTEGADQSPSRLGRLHLLSIIDNVKILEHLQTLDMPAVLDCKWAPEEVSQLILLAVANAAGELSVFSLTSGDSVTSKLKLVQKTKTSLSKQDGERELLALSLDWSVTADVVKIAVSDSQGCISVLRLDSNGLIVEHNWSAHGFEAWIVHWDFFSPQVCYTGGDDGKLRVYDLRDSVCLRLTNTVHTAGVTSLSCSHKMEHSLLSGSYDEQILKWDTRQMKRTVASAITGGGVWRLRRQPVSEDLVLAACMYNGFLVLNSELQDLIFYKEHNSIAYGADWSYINTTEQFPILLLEGALLATCSFYDHKLCISLLKNK